MRPALFYGVIIGGFFALSGCATTEGTNEISTDLLPIQTLDIRPVATPSLTQPEQLVMADAALVQGQAESALGLYSSLTPTARSKAGVALARIALGTSQDIEVELNAALENNLSDLRLWNALGRFYDGQERYLEAQDAYIAAMHAGAPAASAINNMGMSLLYEGRYSEALDKFNQANALSPDQPVFDNNRRLILALQGDYAGAISDMSELRGAQLYNDAGYLAMRRGERDRAQTLLTRALSLSPIYFTQAQSNLDALKLQKAAS